MITGTRSRLSTWPPTARVAKSRPLRWGAALSAAAMATAGAVALTVPGLAGASQLAVQKAALARLGALAPMASSGGVSIPGGYNIAGKKVLLDIYDPASNSFFVPLENGAKAAAKLFGLNLTIEFADNSDSTAISQIRTAIASHYAGVAAKVPDAGVASTACPAVKAGLVFISVNQTAPSPCINVYIGQDEVKAGALVAKYMVQHGLIKRGDHVFCPVESPTETYAHLRRAGVDSVLGTLGITCDEIGTGDSLGPAKSAMVEYLLGHRNTNALIALGGTPLAVAQAAIKQAGLSHVAIGGFDLSFPEILSGLESGAISVSINQEPYAQGFDSIAEIALNLKYSVAPFNVNTSDNALITPSNVRALAPLVPNYQ
jgi:simple sugar transport system substrate-binding protein